MAKKTIKKVTTAIKKAKVGIKYAAKAVKPMMGMKKAKADKLMGVKRLKSLKFF